MWRRRVNYFMTVAVSLVLAVLPADSGDSGRPRSASGRNACSRPSSRGRRGAARLRAALDSRLCDLAGSGSSSSPSGILLLLARSADLKRRINDGMRELWLVPPTACAREGGDRRRHVANGPRAGSTRCARTPPIRNFSNALKWRIFPGVFGFSVLVGRLRPGRVIVLSACSAPTSPGASAPTGTAGSPRT